MVSRTQPTTPVPDAYKAQKGKDYKTDTCSSGLGGRRALEPGVKETL